MCDTVFNRFVTVIVKLLKLEIFSTESLFLGKQLLMDEGTAVNYCKTSRQASLLPAAKRCFHAKLADSLRFSNHFGDDIKAYLAETDELDSSGILAFPGTFFGSCNREWE